MAKESINVTAAHKQFSAAFFNSAWDLLDKPTRSNDEKEKMIHLAHASMCHWLERGDCTDQNLSIGYWQLSRVYAVEGEPENAMKYAKLCLKYSEQAGVEKVYLGYAYEALARAAKLSRSVNDSRNFLTKAMDIVGDLKKDDREQLISDLETI